MAKFRKWGEKVEAVQNFDHKEIFFEKAGEKINIYDQIQTATEDTKIYETLEKYGSLKPLELNKEAVFAEFENYMDQRGLHEQQELAQNMWDKLPLKVREQFHNDKMEFLQNGKQWLETLMQNEKNETEEAAKQAAAEHERRAKEIQNNTNNEGK